MQREGVPCEKTVADTEPPIYSTWQYVITHGISVTIRDKVHITNSWQSSRKKDRFWSARSSVMRLFTQTRPRWELLNKR